MADMAMRAIIYVETECPQELERKIAMRNRKWKNKNQKSLIPQNRWNYKWEAEQMENLWKLMPLIFIFGAFMVCMLLTDRKSLNIKSKTAGKE